MLAGGLVATTVGSAIQPPLVSEEDAVQMINEYNRRLQLHLGLSAMGTSPAPARRPLGLSLRALVPPRGARFTAARSRS